jgi:hypothetical protein
MTASAFPSMLLPSVFDMRLFYFEPFALHFAVRASIGTRKI